MNDTPSSSTSKPVTTDYETLEQVGRYEKALRSIANSVCCEGCNEAKRVALAALSQPSPTAAVEGLREALEGLLREFEKFSRYGSPIAMAANEAVQRAQAALSQPSSPVDQWRCVNCKTVVTSVNEPEKCSECWCRGFAKIDRVEPSSPDVIRAPDGLDESHYRGLAGGVPVSSNEDAETLADELHSLIWEAGKTAAPIEGYPVSKSEEGAFQYGKDCATADIEQVVLQHLNRIANTLEAKPVDAGQVSVRIEPATAQTLMDWNALHLTDEGWTIDLDIWRRAKPVDGEGLAEELRALKPFLEAHHCRTDAIDRAIEAISLSRHLTISEGWEMSLYHLKDLCWKCDFPLKKCKCSETLTDHTLGNPERGKETTREQG